MEKTPRKKSKKTSAAEASYKAEAAAGLLKNYDSAFAEGGEIKCFDLLCLEISKMEGLELLRKLDSRIYCLLNDYFSGCIYSRFAFLAENNDKKGACECLKELLNFKNTVAAACGVISYKMPQDAPFYLYEDFKVKIDYIDKLAAEGCISKADLPGFESVIKSLAALYDEKRRHEAAACGDMAVPKAAPAAEVKKSRKKKPEAVNGKVPKVKELKKAGQKMPGAEAAELFFCIFFAFISMIIGMFAFGTPNEASTGGAILGGIFGVALGAASADLILWRMWYFLRDAFICLAVAIITLALLR